MPEQSSVTPSIPLFAGHVEAKAAEVLNVLIFAHGGGNAPIHTEQLIPIRASLTALVDCLFPIRGDYADFAGADSLDGIDYIHPTRVATLAIVIGRTLGMPRSELINVGMAAALMNVGYLALRRSLLDQPRRLLEGEWEDHIHTHPDRGVTLLARSGLLEDPLRAIAQHHERWDGSGYPGGVRGDEISRHARILAVADTYVSLRSVRPHRPPVDAVSALEEIAAGRGKLFDPDVVDAFEDVIARYTGIMRPSRAAASAAPIAATVIDERIDAHREGGERIDAATPTASDRASAAAGGDEHPRISRHRGARRAHDRDQDSRIEARPATGSWGRLNTVDAEPMTPPPRSRQFEHGTVEPRTRPRSRRTANHHRHGLFASKLYVDAALCGHWPVDRLPR